jgi:DME family drug/metabolite transporter
VTRTKSANLGRGYTIALITTVIWSTTGIFVGYLYQMYAVPPLVLTFWRDGLVAALLIIILLIMRPVLLKTSPSSIRFFILHGVVLAFFNAIWIYSVKLNGAAVGTVLGYSTPAFTALLSHWLLKESLTWRKGLAVVMCLFGCVLVSGAADLSAWQVKPTGIVIGLISGLFFAFYNLFGRSASKRGYYPWTTMVYTFTVAGICLFFMNGIGLTLSSYTEVVGSGNLFWLGKDMKAWCILFLSALPALGGYGLYMVSLTYLPSSVASLIVSLEPAITAVLAYLLLGEVLSVIQIAGSMMILAGVIFLRIYGDEAD